MGRRKVTPGTRCPAVWLRVSVTSPTTWLSTRPRSGRLAITRPWHRQYVLAFHVAGNYLHRPVSVLDSEVVDFQHEVHKVPLACRAGPVVLASASVRDRILALESEACSNVTPDELTSQRSSQV